MNPPAARQVPRRASARGGGRARPGLEPALAFRTLADTTRLRILHLLGGGPLCVGDLVTVLGLPQPLVSRHLAFLRRSLLVEDEKRGAWAFYRLAEPRDAFHRTLLELLDAAAAEVPRAGADSRALRKLRTQGGCCPQHTARRKPR